MLFIVDLEVPRSIRGGGTKQKARKCWSFRLTYKTLSDQHTRFWALFWALGSYPPQLAAQLVPSDAVFDCPDEVVPDRLLFRLAAAR